MSRMKRLLLTCLLSPLALGACDKKSAPATNPSPAEANKGATPAGEIVVTVDDKGYHPDTVYAPPGKPVTITFKRLDALNCGDELVFPELKIKKTLPVGTPVPVEITMPASGQVAFTCGMAMYKGQVVAR